MKAMVIMVIMVQREMRIVKVVITVQRKSEDGGDIWSTW